MISEQEFYNIEIELGISGKNPDYVNLTKQTLSQLAISFKTVLDYGAGMGVYSNTFHEAGFQVYVWEKFKVHRDHIRYNYPHLNIINEPITTDLMLFIEVSEHMTDRQLNNLFNKIKPKYILFSSTSEKQDNDDAWGHINIKTQDDWVRLFYSHDYRLLKHLKYPTEWTKLFELVNYK